MTRRQLQGQDVVRQEAEARARQDAEARAEEEAKVRQDAEARAEEEAKVRVVKLEAELERLRARLSQDE